MNNQNPIEVVYSLSDPLWLIDENGKMSIEDSTSQSKYFDCKTKYSELFIIIPAKSNFVLKRKLIDSIDDCGIKNYPILKKNMLFKTSLKLNSDSSLISKKVMKKINKIRKEKKVKLFQGQINSNTVLLNSEEAF
ncbi:hypothetical protein [Riemerella anatipestifer]|uniref:hypothetical protein n=1 Tax=Riemerella anatipestifer TaxID=34085 RepID=UPI002A8DBC99|nr:hypothetical protein [Riemerella anatipestifer]